MNQIQYTVTENSMKNFESSDNIIENLGWVWGYSNAIVTELWFQGQ